MPRSSVRMKLSSSSRMTLATLLGLRFSSGKRAAHRLDDGRHQLVQERLRRAEVLPAVALRPAEDAAQDVAALLVARRRPVGERERQRADVVRDHAIRRVLEVVELAAVRRRPVTFWIASKIGVNTSVS